MQLEKRYYSIGTIHPAPIHSRCVTLNSQISGLINISRHCRPYMLLSCGIAYCAFIFTYFHCVCFFCSQLFMFLPSGLWRSRPSIFSCFGIPGNEEADRLATWSSHLGQTASTIRIVTEGDLRAASKALKHTSRCQPTFWMGTATNWNRHALSAYTWARTERGPKRPGSTTSAKRQIPTAPVTT